jgi:hypothetical protein
MTSKIKVDNINKVSDDSNIIKKCGTTITLGASGDSIALASGASQTGFGRTGTVDWQTTPKTGDFTAANGEGYFVNTTSGAVTMTMPSGSSGAIVSIQDYNKTFDDNNFTVTPASGEKINGGSASDSLIISTEGQGLTFVYVDSTVGWKTVHENEFIKSGGSFVTATGGTVTECGDYKIHTFTGPGTFAVSAISSCAAKNVVDYLVVAGGGGGGAAYCSGAGGGGAGGFRYYANTTTNPQACGPALPINNFPSGTAITATVASFPIAVGGGGAQGPNTPTAVASSGVASTFSSITSAGGGGGGSEGAPAPAYTGASGGSGGGGGYHGGSGGSGAGNTPPTSPAQGTAGGNFGGPSPGCRMGGGGGGGIQAGYNGAPGAPAPVRGNGGAGGGVKGFGTSGESCGSHYYFAGGGGGQSQFNPRGNPGTTASVAQGGLGGGGNGSCSSGPAPFKVAGGGTANTGGGGGGATSSVGGSTGSGGSGIVVIRYKFQ